MLFVALCVLIVAFAAGLKIAAEFDGQKPLTHRNLLRDATPDHYQGRDGDFDSHGRPW